MFVYVVECDELCLRRGKTATTFESDSNNRGINHLNVYHVTGCFYLLLCLQSKLSFVKMSSICLDVNFPK